MSTNTAMKRLLIPFFALALCPPAQADRATFKLSDLQPLPSINCNDGDVSVRLAELPGWGSKAEYVEPNNPLIKRIEEQRKRQEELKRQQEIARCKAYKKRWKQFGGYEYDWLSWKQTKGTWVTTRKELVGEEKISVTCKGLQVSAYSGLWNKWESWRLPNQGGETEMVAALCTEKNK